MNEEHGINQLVDGRVMFGDAGITPDLEKQGYVCHLCTTDKNARIVDLALTKAHLEQIAEGAKRFLRENGIKIETVWTERVPDAVPDLSWLESKYDEESQTIISSSRYTNDDIKAYGWGKVKGWIDDDTERLKAYGHDWVMVGVRAFARVQIPTTQKGHRIVTPINTPGTWGIESDSGDAHFKELEDEELNILREMFRSMGITEGDIKRHIEAADRKNE